MEQIETKVKDKFFRNGRWFIRLSTKLNGAFTMPYANYIWLQGNPSFLTIPRGYVIHHLDGDETNDSIVNLVLMQKHHHAAYHFSQKIIKPELKLRNAWMKLRRTVYFPTRKPRIHRRGKERYYLQFMEIIGGEYKKTAVYSWDGVVISTREMAEKVRDAIWSPEKKREGES